MKEEGEKNRCDTYTDSNSAHAPAYNYFVIIMSRNQNPTFPCCAYNHPVVNQPIVNLPHPPPNIHPHTHTSTAFLCSVYCKHQPAGTLAATPHTKQNTKTKVPVLSVTILLTVDIPRRILCGTQKKVRVMCIHQLIFSHSIRSKNKKANVPAMCTSTS